jgi:hypothetical protein
MNQFDSIQAAAFDVVTSTFGYNAKWTPANGGAEITAQVLYKDATDKHGLSDEDFEVERYKAEYKENDFAGLKDLVDAADTMEHLQIELTAGVWTDFIVRHIKRKYDGKTFIAYLNPPD